MARFGTYLFVLVRRVQRARRSPTAAGRSGRRPPSAGRRTLLQARHPDRDRLGLRPPAPLPPAPAAAAVVSASPAVVGARRGRPVVPGAAVGGRRRRWSSVTASSSSSPPHAASSALSADAPLPASSARRDTFRRRTRTRTFLVGIGLTFAPSEPSSGMSELPIAVPPRFVSPRCRSWAPTRRVHRSQHRLSIARRTMLHFPDCLSIRHSDPVKADGSVIRRFRRRPST